MATLDSRPLIETGTRSVFGVPINFLLLFVNLRFLLSPRALSRSGSSVDPFDATSILFRCSSRVLIRQALHFPILESLNRWALRVSKLKVSFREISWQIFASRMTASVRRVQREIVSRRRDPRYRVCPLSDAIAIIPAFGGYVTLRLLVPRKMSAH